MHVRLQLTGKWARVGKGCGIATRHNGTAPAPATDANAAAIYVAATNVPATAGERRSHQFLSCHADSMLCNACHQTSMTGHVMASPAVWQFYDTLAYGPVQACADCTTACRPSRRGTCRAMRASDGDPSAIPARESVRWPRVCLTTCLQALPQAGTLEVWLPCLVSPVCSWCTSQLLCAVHRFVTMTPWRKLLSFEMGCCLRLLCCTTQCPWQLLAPSRC